LEERLSASIATAKAHEAEILARAPAYQSTPFPVATPRAVDTDTPVGEQESAVPSDSSLPPSESTNVWPDEAAEAAFISESRGRGEVASVTPAAAEVVEERADKPLPKLDELVQRIPDEARELLDELFRAKFVAVRRVPQNALKP
jgi:hypothetical protein